MDFLKRKKCVKTGKLLIRTGAPSSWGTDTFFMIREIFRRKLHKLTNLILDIFQIGSDPVRNDPAY